MKRFITTLAVAATLALSAASLAGSTLLSKEDEPRNGNDNPPKIERQIVGREDELRNGNDNGPDDHGRNRGSGGSADSL